MKKLILFYVISFLPLFGLSQNPLFIPDTLSGANINLDLQEGTYQFYSGQPTNTMGANGNILGPTLFLKQGENVQFAVNNQLMDTTTIHWHGLHVAPENDGGPHTFILPNSTWTPSFTVLDKAATYWYHPHLHHKTDHHVSKGIAGMIIVRDSAESQLNLPRTYGVDDIPLVIQTKDFDANNQIVIHSNSDNVVMVNATLNPFQNVPAQVVRLRVLNGSSQRAFNLGLSNNQTFYQIASDGGLLSAPVQLTRLLIAPGERAEILVNFTGMTGQNMQLMSYASEFPNGIYGATNPGMGAGMTLTGYNPNPMNGTNFNILQFNVQPATTNPVTSVPTQLVTVPVLAASSANITRALTFTPVTMGPNQLNGNFLINNMPFDMMMINYTIPIDNVEIWELTNQSAIAHPFHIHDVQFNILTRNGVAPPLNEQGRKDVVLVKPQEVVRFIAKFETFSNPDVPYMYHCHMLTHEDGGMMGQFIVVNPLGLNENNIGDKEIQMYPNPSIGSVTLKYQNTPSEIKVSDAIGRIIFKESNPNENKTIELLQLPKGVLFVTLQYANDTITRKLIVE